MSDRSIQKTVDANLCVSCEACVAVCPTGAVATGVRDGQLLPAVDSTLCTECGRCRRVCPGLDFAGACADADAEDLAGSLVGPVLGAYDAWAKDDSVRERATSGGVVSALLAALVEDERIDGAFVLPFDDASAVPRLELATSAGDVHASGGSKYLPASMLNVLRTLAAEERPRYAVVGTPCQLSAVKKFMRAKKLPEDGMLFVGLFCDQTMNLNLLRYLEDEYGNGERLVGCAYRSKESRGWPGDLRLEFESGRVVTVAGNVRVDLKPYFRLKRCTVCLDKLNVAADLSVGDCYVPGRSDRLGASSVIVRTERGREVLQRYASLFELRPADAREIADSQRIGDREENLRRAGAVARDVGLPADGVLAGAEPPHAHEYQRDLERLEMGRRYRRSAIRRSSRLLAFEKRLDRLTNRAAVAATVLWAALRLALGRNRTAPRGDYVAMLGATFDNKGAQGMIFTVMDEIGRRMPDARFVLLSPSEMVARPLERYRLETVPWTIGMKSRLVGGPGRFVDDPVPRGEAAVARLDEVLSQAACIVDISGYRLGSQWGFANTLDYLLNLMVARLVGVPCHVLPQSLGPFDYPRPQRIVLDPLIRLALRSAETVFAREDQGFESVSRYSRRNLVRAGDIVLGSRDDKSAEVYREGAAPAAVEVEPGTVGVVPSTKVVERLGAAESSALYSAIVEELLGQGRRVAFVVHSTEDGAVCARLAEPFAEDGRVSILGEGMDAIELEDLLGRMDFIVASRFHSVVHAYRRATPAVVIGWATKYRELASAFGQQRYVFDVRRGADADDVLDAVREMMTAYVAESDRIREGFGGRNNDAVFDRVVPAGPSRRGGSPGPSPDRLARSGLAVLLVAALALALDTVTMRRDWAYTKPRRAGDSLLRAAGPRKSVNIVNIMIGIAARDMAGGVPELLLAPEDVAALAAGRTPEGDPGASGLSFGTIKQMTGGRLEQASYEVPLAEETLRRLDEQGLLVAYPHDVYGLRGGPYRSLVLRSDPARGRILILPLDGEWGKAAR